MQELSKEDYEKIESIQNLREFLKKESDRGCCLLAVSFLDNELKLLLNEKLIGTRKIKETIFSFSGPLGTFSSKIDLGYSIGLISDALRKDIHIIRKIRNEFGHNYTDINFETQNIKNRILELQHNFYEKDECSIRKMFINTVTLILAEISDASDTYAKFEKKEDKVYLGLSGIKNFIKEGTDIIYNKKK